MPIITTLLMTRSPLFKALFAVASGFKAFFAVASAFKAFFAVVAPFKALIAVDSPAEALFADASPGWAPRALFASHNWPMISAVVRLRLKPCLPVEQNW